MLLSCWSQSPVTSNFGSYATDKGKGSLFACACPPTIPFPAASCICATFQIPEAKHILSGVWGFSVGYSLQHQGCEL